MKKTGFSKNKNLYVFLIIFIIIILFLIIQNILLVGKLKEDNIDNNSIEVAIENSTLDYQLNNLNFTNNEIPIEITELNGSNLETLKNKYPVIYNKAEEGFFYVKFPSWIVIYDFNNNLVIDKFRFQSVNIQ